MSEESENLRWPTIGDLLKADRTDPAGESLDDTGEVDTLQRLARGTPETEVAGKVIPAKPPNWPVIEEMAVELLGRSVDIRVLIVLAQAALRGGKLQVFANCLDVSAALVRDQWGAWYPRTLEGGNIDAEERENAIAAVADTAMLASLRAARPFSVPLLRACAIGDFLPDASARESSLHAIARALADAQARGEVEATHRELERSAQALVSLSEALRGRDLFGDFSRLAALLSGASAALSNSIGQASDSAAAPDAAAPELAESSVQEHAMHPAAENLSRESAKRTLQQLIDYFVRVEPSSPVPLYLRRAQSLIGLEFSDVVREMGDDVSKFSRS